MSSTVSTALIIIGLIGLITGGTLLIVNTAQKRFKGNWKPGTSVAIAGIALLLAGSLAAASPPTASFEVSNCSLEPDGIILGDIVTITVEVENTDKTEGSYQLVMFVDEEAVMTRTVTLAGTETETISFNCLADAPGVHKVRIGELTELFEVRLFPKFDIIYCSVTPDEALSGESITVEATVMNTSMEADTYQAILLLDGSEVATKEVSLAAGEQTAISFVVSADALGFHEIELGRASGVFHILVPAQFEIKGLDISPNPVKASETAVASLDVENVGEAEGAYTASLVVDGITMATEDITLSGDTMGSISFPLVKEAAGSYSIGIAGQAVVLNVIEPVRPDTGTYLVKDMPHGKAKLTVENGLDLDAVVILSLAEEPDKPLAAVYIQADDDYTIKQIDGETYILYFSLGKDLDDGSHKFMSEATYERFEDEIKFVSSSSSYSVITVTLHPVAGGTAATEHLGEDEFPEL